MLKIKRITQQTKFKDLKSNSDIILNKSTNEISNFRSRTLKTREVDDKILSEDVIFYAYGFCKSCNEYINLMNLCSDLSQLKTKTEGGKDYFKCPNKHQKNNSNDYIPLKIGINFGVELFNLKIKTNKQSTSSNYVIDLLSPSTIKKRLLRIAKDLGENKFDVEKFKKNYKDLFWNVVWFFELNNMDISFMLPYCYESCYILNDNQSEKIKKAVLIKYKRDQDIDIEKIVAHPDLNVNIIFYGNVKALGDKINQEDIKNNVFTNIKHIYNLNDIVIQKIFQFHISDKLGMVSYMGFNRYSENIGYNELPDRFEEIISNENDDFSFYSSRSNTKISESILSLNISSSISSNLASPTTNKKSIRKTVNFEENNENNINNKNKVTSSFRSKFSGSNKSILKQSKKNLTTEVDISNKLDDTDFLSKFKESQKKIEDTLKNIKKEKNENDNNNNTNKILRNSTLKKRNSY